MYKINDVTIKEGRAFVHPETGVQYPSNWMRLSDQDKSDLNIVWHDAPVKRDPWDWRELEDRPEFEEDGTTPLLDEDGNQVITRGLKYDQLIRVERIMIGLLEPTDPLFAKAKETGELVSPEDLAYRQAVRRAKKTMDEAISTCSTKEELKALMDNTVDEEDNVTIALLNQWPDKNNLPPYVPYQVTRLQARVVLRSQGLIETIEASLTDPVELEYWTEASIFKRNSPLIAKLTATLGLTEEEVDNLFIAASNVE